VEAASFASPPQVLSWPHTAADWSQLDPSAATQNIGIWRKPREHFAFIFLPDAQRRRCDRDARRRTNLSEFRVRARTLR
jgi:hypothetical protein